MTFTRGDIVRLRSDEQEAGRCEGESSREYHRSRRYIVLGEVESGFAFRVGNVECRRTTLYSLWPITPWPQVVPVNAYEGNLIATDKTLGADLIGAHLALKAGVRIDYLPADWTRGGTVECDKSAGPERTAMMIEHANGLVVVRHKWAVGSAHAVEFARRKWGHDAKEIEDVLIEKRVAKVAR